MASPKMRGQGDWNRGPEVAAREIVEIVILSDDEALPGPLGVGIDASMQLEDDGPTLQVELGGVAVRDVYDLCVPSGPNWQNFPPSLPDAR